MSRRICVVTGSRSEYGLLRWVMDEIRRSPSMTLQVVVTGMHLSPDFGLTVRDIERDGFTVDERVDMLLSSDSAAGLTKSVGVGVIGFADVYRRLAPDAVVVLGDRFEILAAAQAAFFAGISIAHISGGEVTEGSMDDAIRHCLTKLSRYHFVAAETYRKRVIQLGESPDRVFNVGDPGLDNIRRLSLLPAAEVGAAVGLNTGRPFFVVTYHPATVGTGDPATGMQALLDGLDQLPGYDVLFTKSNADAGGRALNAMVDAYAAARPGRVVAATSWGQLLYLSAMKLAAAVVGNSSSGIVEAPALKVPTVNVGRRQDGRLKASSIIDCDESRDSVAAAIHRAVSPDFAATVATTESLYGDCDACARIASALAELPLDHAYAKRFHDITGA